jgi:type IV secretion system protein VirB5
MRMTRTRLVSLVILLSAAASARAQMAVIDVASLARLAQQAQTLMQQLAAARAQLLQLQTQYQSMTGNRDMQSLLSGTVRNYLPTNWSQLSGVMQGNGGSGYGTLAQGVQGNVQANAILSPQQLATLPVAERAQITATRQSVALVQALAQDELSNVSARFASIQRLIDAIPSAKDQKGILDLQARINAEQGMLQNEQTKLLVLFQAAVGQDWAIRQRERELIIAGQGRFATRFEPSPR